MTDLSAVTGPVHHVGFVVRTLEPAETLFGALGYARLADSINDPRQDAEIVFLARSGRVAGEPLIELVRPLSEASPVHAFGVESRMRIHHLCFSVLDIEQASTSLRRRRVTQVMPVVDAPAIGGRRITFFFSRGTGLFELVERPPF
ncbi:VOC family protein [soil metagenome]